MQPGQAQAE